jgi:hypothetical protein
MKEDFFSWAGLIIPFLGLFGCLNHLLKQNCLFGCGENVRRETRKFMLLSSEFSNWGVQ